MHRNKRRSTNKISQIPITIEREQREEKTKIQVINYDEKTLDDKETYDINEALAYVNKSNMTWIRILGMHNVDIVEKIGDFFKLHPLLLDDISEIGQRPKIEEFGEYLLIVIRRLYYDKKDNELKDFQISVIVGDLFIITFQEQVDEIFDIILERIIKAKGKIRQTGSDYLVYRILDSIVDSYFVLLENLSGRIDLVEDLVIKEPSRENIQAIHTFKRDVLYLHKSIWPLREIVNSISRIELPYLKETNNIYFRDVQNHIIQIIDSIDIFREMLNGMFEIYLSSISNRLNQIMKILTIISTIFIPLSFIASLYGMNFRYMPELQSPIGYYIVVFVMIFIGLFMLIYFKKKDWF